MSDGWSMKDDVCWVKLHDYFVHKKNIFASGELEKDSVTEKISATASDGKNYLTQFYNLDAVISVGYRVVSKRLRQIFGSIAIWWLMMLCYPNHFYSYPERLRAEGWCMRTDVWCKRTQLTLVRYVRYVRWGSSDCSQTVPKGFKTKAYSGWIKRSQRICAVCSVSPGTVCAILFCHRGAVCCHRLKARPHCLRKALRGFKIEVFRRGLGRFWRVLGRFLPRFCTVGDKKL